MKQHITSHAISLIAVLFCIPAMAARDLSINQEITNLLKNPDFGNGFQGWTLTQQGGNITTLETNGTFEVQAMGCEFVLEQTITDLPDGIYELQLDGYFAAESMPKSMLHGSMFSMNDMKNVIISSYEYTEDNPTNIVIAKPEDGALTIRIIGRCPASSADYTVFSNLHLLYRGKDDTEAKNICSNRLLDMRGILETMWKCNSTDITDYIQHPSCNAALMKAVGEEAYSTTVTWNKIYSNLHEIGNLMEEVCNSRTAYIKLMNNVLQTENTANLLIDNNLITEGQYSKVTKLLDTAIKGYTEGSLTNSDINNLLQQMAALDGLPKYVDNIMQISSPNELCSFSVLVNEGMRTLSAQLTTDIDMKGITDFQPIGLYSDIIDEQSDFLSNSFGGTFNGQGFEIRNLTLRTTYEGGLFGRCYRAKISNLGLVNISVTGTGTQTCGALAGTLMQTLVDNCYVAGNIQISANGTMKAQFAGESTWNTQFSNCYTLGNEFTNATEAELNNCYWGNWAIKTATSGELCYTLNNEDTFSPVYFQNLGKDAYPVLLSSHEIVRRTKEGIYYNGDDEDAINNIEGQGVRGKEQGIFDLSGRRISRKPTKGMYIQGGKIRL